MFTHFSLFTSDNGCTTLADFAPIPEGGVPQLLNEFHSASMTEHPTYCAWPKCCLHPDGNQVSFENHGRTLILMSRNAVAGHAVELRWEGNRESADKASVSLM